MIGSITVEKGSMERDENGGIRAAFAEFSRIYINTKLMKKIEIRKLEKQIERDVEMAMYSMQGVSEGAENSRNI